jgi:hypothetical protein
LGAAQQTHWWEEDMDYQAILAAQAIRRLNRLEDLGRHHFNTGIRTNNAARIVRVVRFLDAVNAKTRSVVVKTDVENIPENVAGNIPTENIPAD